MTRTLKLGARPLLGSTLLLTLSLAGCGGGGGDADSPSVAAPQEVESVPESAFASTEAMETYQRSLTLSDRSEPLELGDLTPPVDDRAEPVPIG